MAMAPTIRVVAVATTAVLALGLQPAHASEEKKVIALVLQGPRSADLSDSIARMIEDPHEVIAKRIYARTAMQLDSTPMTPRNIARVAAEIEADAVLEGTLARKGRAYRLRVHLFEGRSGRTVKEAVMVLDRPRLDRSSREELMNVLAAIEDVEPLATVDEKNEKKKPAAGAAAAAAAADRADDDRAAAGPAGPKGEAKPRAHDTTQTLVDRLVALPVFRSEWVLWLLLSLSFVSMSVVVERWLFYRRRTIDIYVLRRELERHLVEGDYAIAAAELRRHDSMETNVVLVGLQAYQQGAESVEDLLAGALGREKARYERRLNVLATLASNAPYIGLFGTVLGIIRAFRDLAGNMADGSQAVMAGIGEALVATAVGLMVALPAVVAYNAFKGRVKNAVTDCQVLATTLLSHLKSADPGRAPSE